MDAGPAEDGLYVVVGESKAHFFDDTGKHGGRPTSNEVSGRYACLGSAGCNATICCTGICCFINRHQRELWETWYFWFGVVLIFLFVLTSAFSYMVTSCKRKQQNLIRIRNITTPGAPSITTISGPGGIIQPQVNYKGQLGMQATAFIGSPEMYLEDYASPLDAPYPPVQPVTIVRGTVPPQGYRQTNQYTELVLPPGYVDTESRVKHLIASQ
ncbi:uncharacterized protein [Anabrus simplex]|uniref:uncharacterized protein n=1 Tax=Anabrus simplex TaxID=316456 RepID=UPI0035A2DE4C